MHRAAFYKKRILFHPMIYAWFMTSLLNTQHFQSWWREPQMGSIHISIAQSRWTKTDLINSFVSLNGSKLAENWLKSKSGLTLSCSIVELCDVMTVSCHALSAELLTLPRCERHSPTLTFILSHISQTFKIKESSRIVKQKRQRQLTE